MQSENIQGTINSSICNLPNWILYPINLVIVSKCYLMLINIEFMLLVRPVISQLISSRLPVLLRRD